MEGARNKVITAAYFALKRFRPMHLRDDKMFHEAVYFLMSHTDNPYSSSAARSLFDKCDGVKISAQGNYECETKKMVSDMIQIYVANGNHKPPFYEVKHVVSQFKDLHRKLEVTPSSSAYQKLIVYCCDSREVHVAIELVEEMIHSGFPLSLDTLHYILTATGEEFDYYLVYKIYSLMNRCNVKPNGETFRIMLDFCLKVKNYDGAFSLLCHLEKNDALPTAAMYYAVMHRYYQENLSHQSENLGEMKEADMEPDNLGETKEADIEPDDNTRDYKENMSRQLEILEEKKEADIKLHDQNCDDPENMSRQLEILKEKKGADIKLDDQNCDGQKYLSCLLEILKEANIEPDHLTCDPLLRNY